MRNFRARILWCIILACFGLITLSKAPSWAESAKMLFSISLEQNECKSDEPIYVTFKLQNKDKRGVYVNKRFYLGSEEMPKEKREVFLIVSSPSSTKLICKYLYETGLPKSEYFELLEPQKEVISEFKRDLRAYFDFAESGTYQIVAVYQNVYGKEIGLDTFTDKVISKPVLLKILPKN